MNIVHDIIFVFWFFLPAGVAILTPVYAAKAGYLKSFSYPVDCYATFRKKRIFGDNKTIRGFIIGTISSILFVYLQVFLCQQFPWLQQIMPVDYNQINPLLLGFLLGFGGLAGDSIESFFKRQLNIAPGTNWFPFDQTDHIIGGILFTLFYIRLTLLQYLLLIIVWFAIHIITNLIGYLLKIKKTPF